MEHTVLAQRSKEDLQFMREHIIRINMEFLCSPSSPDIERENPFRDAMLKFAALEKKVKGKEEKERERKMSNRATGTSAQPSQVINRIAIFTHAACKNPNIINRIHTEWFKWFLLRKLKYSICFMINVIVKVERARLNSIQSTSFSCATFSWTTMNIFTQEKVKLHSFTHMQVSTATQTIGVLQKRGQQQGTPRSPFKTVLSSATPASVTPMRHQIPQQPQQPQSMMTRTTTMRQLR